MGSRGCDEKKDQGKILFAAEMLCFCSFQVGRPNNVPQAAPIIAHIQEEARKYPRIYVASIHTDLTNEDVQR